MVVEGNDGDVIKLLSEVLVRMDSMERRMNELEGTVGHALSSVPRQELVGKAGGGDGGGGAWGFDTTDTSNDAITSDRVVYGGSKAAGSDEFVPAEAPPFFAAGTRGTRYLLGSHNGRASGREKKAASRAQSPPSPFGLMPGSPLASAQREGELDEVDEGFINDDYCYTGKGDKVVGGSSSKGNYKDEGENDNGEALGNMPAHFEQSRLVPSSSGAGRPSSARGTHAPSTSVPPERRTFETSKNLRKFLGTHSITSKSGKVARADEIGPVSGSRKLRPASSGRTRRKATGAEESGALKSSLPARPVSAVARLRSIKAKVDSNLSVQDDGEDLSDRAEAAQRRREAKERARKARDAKMREVLRTKVMKASCGKVLYRHIKGSRAGVSEPQAEMNNNEPTVYHSHQERRRKPKASIVVNRMNATGSLY